MIELALNLVWMVTAAAMCWLWAHHARREGWGRSSQFVCLVLVLFILFPVITMYDDIAMAQNAVETRRFQREDELSAHAHAPLHPVVASTFTLAAELPFSTSHLAVPGGFLVPKVDTPVLLSMQNRPPPAA